MAVALAGLVFGPQLAHVIGAYALIVLAWLGGALIGLWRRDPSDRLGVARFVIVSLVLTLGATVPVARWIDGQFNGVDAANLLFPVAFLIPAIGTDWVRIGRWVADLVGRRWSRGNDGGQP